MSFLRQIVRDARPTRSAPPAAASRDHGVQRGPVLPGADNKHLVSLPETVMAETARSATATPMGSALLAVPSLAPGGQDKQSRASDDPAAGAPSRFAESSAAQSLGSALALAAQATGVGDREQASASRSSASVLLRERGHPKAPDSESTVHGGAQLGERGMSLGERLSSPSVVESARPGLQTSSVTGERAVRSATVGSAKSVPSKPSDGAVAPERLAIEALAPLMPATLDGPALAVSSTLDASGASGASDVSDASDVSMDATSAARRVARPAQPVPSPVASSPTSGSAASAVAPRHRADPARSAAPAVHIGHLEVVVVAPETGGANSVGAGPVARPASSTSASASSARSAGRRLASRRFLRAL